MIRPCPRLSPSTLSFRIVKRIKSSKDKGPIRVDLKKMNTITPLINVSVELLLDSREDPSYKGGMERCFSDEGAIKVRLSVRDLVIDHDDVVHQGFGRQS